MTKLLPFNTSHLPVRLTLDDYLLLDGAGAFRDYAKTELIDGEILFVNAQHQPHARVKSRLFIELAAALAESGLGCEAIVEGSIAVPPKNAPEPDIVVTDAPEGAGLIPLVSVKLVVEVSDATLTFDLGRKLAVYARHAVPEYWVVDVGAGMLHQHWTPHSETYAERRTHRLGETIAAATMPLTIAVPAG